MNKALTLVKNTLVEWWEDQATRFSAAISFYTMMSLAPLLVIVVAVVGLVVGGSESAQTKITAQAQDMAGPQAASAVTQVIQNAHRPTASIVGLTLGVILLLVGATGVFSQLQTALNTMWEIEPQPNRGIWGMLRNRLLKLLAIGGVAFLLLVSLVASAGVAALGTRLRGVLPRPELLVGALDAIVSLVVLTLLFAFAFKVLPDAKIRWRDLWVGAFGTAVLFTIGKSLIGFYLGHSATSSAFGAAASLAVLLIWVYYSSMIFLLGAEFTQVYANMYGAKVISKAEAERIAD